MTSSHSHEDAVLMEAAHRLADTITPYRVLTREKLAELSGEDHWRTVSFERALQWAVDHDVLRALGPDLYEICSPPPTQPSQPANG